MSGESIKVCCRFRKEGGDDESEFEEWEFDESSAEIRLREKKWTYDYILNHKTEQDEMYDKVGKQTIADFMNGFNGTIFAYGQSGSGKTFSMLGPEDVTDALSKDFNSVPESVTQLYGITPRAVIQMFETINSYVAQGSNCTLICSYIEIYNETIKCLLSKKDNLKIREQPGMGMNVADKEIRVCRTPEEIFECVSLATKNRAVTGTNQNARSSRSHTILLLEFEYHGIDGVKRSSRLNLVDLAGCERISKTGCEGQSLKEAQKINQSLTTLGMCIMALTTAGSKHIPFRNSKLTLILKESLGGNSKTTLLCTASRRKIHAEESAQTLYFASRAKAIKNNCKTNVQLGVKELQYLADNMKKEILTLRGQLKKGGINYNMITDPKLLAIISNSEFDGGDEEGESHSLSEEDQRKRRISLLNLSEKDIIIKYCELRAKFDNLLENAGNKIYQLNQARTENSADVSGEMNSLKIETDEKLRQIVESKDLEINQLIEKIEFIRKEADQKNEQLNKTNQEMFKSKLVAEEELENSKKDYDSLQEMFNLTQNDISFFQEKLTKKKQKSSNYKEEIKLLKQENLKQLESVEELNKKISEHESKNLETKQKIDELSNKNELLVLEVENLKNQLKQKEENEAFQINKNRELGEEINRGLENILSKEKRINELINQISEVEMKNKNEVESLQKKEGYALAENEALKKENENLNKMMQAKISDQSILAEKEKILNEVKSTLECRINDLSSENDRIKRENLDTISKFNAEKSELNFQIENLNVELKNKLNEIESIKFESETLKKNSEENLKNEQLKTEQLQIKLEASEKKNYEIESNILLLTDTEKKLSAEKYSMEKDLKEKTQLLEESYNKNNLINEKLEKSEKELRELRDSVIESKNKSIQEFEAEKKNYSSEIAELKSQFEFKSKKVEDGDRKINELKAEIKVLQNSNQNIQKKLNEIELDHSRVKRQSILLQKEVQSIKKEAPLNKNIFGVLLKKTGDNNNFLKSAIQETKNIQKRTEDIFQDKIDELKKFRENIVSLSPKTVSSRSDIDDIPELDFQDEESFKKAEQLILEKETKYQEDKKNKDSMII